MTDKERARQFHSLHHYDNIFYCSVADCATAVIYPTREYTLNYVVSGEMILNDGFNDIRIQQNESAFIPRAHHISATMSAAHGQPYRGIAILFPRQYLKKIYQTYQPIHVPSNTPRLFTASMKLPQTDELKQLFSDLLPYCDHRIKPEADFMATKSKSGLDALLHISNRFVPTLFDFKAQWKIDIIDFMSLNYTIDWSLPDLAHYTGRSLATFKREFARLKLPPPQKWLIQKRLEVAREKLAEDRQNIAELATEVGFKNSAHFATAFKSQYGQPPSVFAAKAQSDKLTKK